MTLSKTTMIRCGAGLALAACTAIAAADDQPALPGDATVEIDFSYTSGLVANAGDEMEVVWAQEVNVPGAGWVRLQFSDVLLSGDARDETGSFLRITSLEDGAVQYLNAIHVQQWNQTSAYFNGDTVLVEIVAQPGTGNNHLTIDGAWTAFPVHTDRSICGPTDDRVLSNDPRQGRYLPAGCTAWLWDDAERCFGSAGHCVSSPGVIEFNVPLSTCASFSCIQHPPPEDQFSVDNSSMQSVNGGIGNDWAYFGTFPNSNTGLTPYESQGNVSYELADVAPPQVNGETIRITGYGSTSSPVDPTWYLAQKTHTGPFDSISGTTLRYRPDTTGGNSGSPVINDSDNGIVIGVHTHAGCNSTGGANQGTSVNNAGWLAARANALGICGEPPPPPEGPLFLGNNGQGFMGSANRTDGSFGPALPISGNTNAMAFDGNTNTISVATETGDNLLAVDGADFSFSVIGTITGVPTGMYGMAFDESTNTLYGVDQTNGQLYRVNTSTAAATPIGSATGLVLGGLAFDSSTGTLYAADDSTVPSRLVRLNTTTGAATVVGSFGSGLTDVDALAYCDDTDTLLAFNDGSNDSVYTVNRSNGSASLLTSVPGGFGAVVGMTCATVADAGCAADLTGSSDPNAGDYGQPDGDADGDDFFFYLDAFTTGNLAVCDFTGSSDPNNASYGNPDGDCDGDDFFFYLDLFVAGCN
ncbi:MAG: GC-type dockerin domain-anchored protein [Phycisphaerales bacterium JB037]